jgi:SpoVK/Ycf46/Vps4 family AAA+-type ATPase
MKQKQNKFIQFLDIYNEKKYLNTIDYSVLITAINCSYFENNIFDSSLVGKVKTTKNTRKSSVNNYRDPFIFDYSMNSFYNHYSGSLWNEINNPETSTYDLWQKTHEVVLPEVKKEYFNIDASLTTLKDIIKIIEENEYKQHIEYNIDLKSLHNIKSELLQLDNMIGMDSMKQSILDQLIYFIQELHINGENSDFKHTVICGPPGTGKTEIAKIIGKMYSKLGILKNNIFKKVTRNDLIAGYLGQTALKTKKVIDECLGGVLFIDEAYSLANSDFNDSYSKECIDILCESLSDHKNDLMVIIAGYENELNETFFRANKGLQSRFIWRFIMEAYSSKEMMNIFKKMVQEQEWYFENEDDIRERWFEDKKDNFTNYGRDMEALFTYSKISHGRRIYGKNKENRKKLSLDDINKGYKTFLDNKKTKKDSMHLYGIYV